MVNLNEGGILNIPLSLLVKSCERLLEALNVIRGYYRSVIESELISQIKYANDVMTKLSINSQVNLQIGKAAV